MPTPDEEYVLYILAGMWGFTDGIWQTQINGKYLVTLHLVLPLFVEIVASYVLWVGSGIVLFNDTWSQ